MIVYPCHKHILPGGRQKLTFSSVNDMDRMLTMIERSPVFIASMIEPDDEAEPSNLPETGTVVTIKESQCDQKNGLILLLEGCYKVEIVELERDVDGWLLADVRRQANWDSLPLSGDNDILASKLEDLFESVPEIGELYNDTHFNDLTWVTQRWIEILPLNVLHKRMLITQPNPELAQRFLLKLLKAENWI
uniref:LON peptidase substrate-binding domain-containing protein n=1 Tax=Thaumasiovibrio occultus TaxID=1891184 RepID=UPI000B354F8B|nr:LON peptidase substrate-binding domain-containing protein [Thaumasiovibrio occultus]